MLNDQRPCTHKTNAFQRKKSTIKHKSHAYLFEAIEVGLRQRLWVQWRVFGEDREGQGLELIRLRGREARHGLELNEGPGADLEAGDDGQAHARLE